MSGSRLTNLSTFSTFQKNVTTSGTPVQLTASVIPDGIQLLIKAKKANTGTITIGNSSANALNTDTLHFKLEPNECISIQPINANLVWLDSTVNGEGVECIVETQS
jgi:hypothetical protein